MKLLLVCTSGGHFATMRSLEPFWSRHQKTWVCDRKADTEVLSDKETVHWTPYQAPRDLLALIKNIPKTIKVLWQERPEMVVSTGASVAINYCLIAKLLGIRFIYIESISRAERLSISGQLVYWLCDEFYVQWPQLCNRYPKATFQGYAA
jgi:beta-1,4-N-acetylglucosaminyltransferase